jgi:hypothetical protein
VYDTWCLTLWYEHKLTVFESRLLRNISGPKKDVVHLTGDWRKSCNKELQELYSSSSIIRVVKSRRIRWTGDMALMGGGGTANCARFET